jgi:hypothetical protein
MIGGMYGGWLVVCTVDGWWYVRWNVWMVGGMYGGLYGWLVVCSVDVRLVFGMYGGLYGWLVVCMVVFMVSW